MTQDKATFEAAMERAMKYFSKEELATLILFMAQTYGEEKVAGYSNISSAEESVRIEFAWLSKEVLIDITQTSTTFTSTTVPVKSISTVEYHKTEDVSQVIVKCAGERQLHYSAADNESIGSLEQFYINMQKLLMGVLP